VGSTLRGPRPILIALVLLAAVCGAAQEQSGGSAGASYLLLDKQVGAAEQELAARILQEGAPLTERDLEKLQGLLEEARISLYGDLMDRSALLVMLAEESIARESLIGTRSQREKEFLESRALQEKEATARRRRSAVLWGSVGTTAASFAAAFAFWYLSEWQDERYFSAPTVEEAVRHRTYFKLFSWASYLAAGVGVIGVGVTVPVLLRSSR
jgi:hypothetical protein